MSERRRFLVLIAIMVAVALITTAAAIRILYIAAVTEQHNRLVETAQSQARLIEAVARFDAAYSQDYPAGARQATISQIVDAHNQYKGFGETGEFTLAQLAADSIVFLLSHRHYDLEHPRPVPFDSDLAEPTRRALSGESGTLMGLDYRGQLVLAAYEPVGELDLGIVAKIDMAEIRAPFWRAGIVVAVIAVLVIALGGWIFLQVSNPIITRLEGSVARLQKSEAKNRALINAIPDGLFIFDHEGTFLEFEPADEFVTVIPPEQFLGRNIREILPADVASQSLEKLQEAITTGEPAIFEYMLPMDGEEKYFESRQVRMGSNEVLGIVRDITEHKRADIALKESENRHRLLFNVGDDALFVYHLTEEGPGKLIEVNDVVCERLGYSREELLNLTVADISKLEPAALKAGFKRLLHEKQIRLETVHVARNGREIPVEVSANLFALDGRTAVLSIARDITKRLKAEQERERLLMTLKEKNDDLEQIVRISSHDLRSPLINISGFAGVIDRNIERAVKMLSAPGKEDEAGRQLQPLLEIDTREAVEHISKGARRMESLISGLLRLMRLGKMDVEIQQLDMNALLGEITQSFSYQIEQAGVQVEIGDLPPCCGDRLQIGQVFSNLFDNALKYLDAERSGVVRVSGQQTGRLVEYCVEDNGIGIAPKHYDLVFQLFHRMHPSKTTGEGVGLTLIKKIIDRHGGQIRLESEPGEGSRFYVTLPIKAGAEQ